MSAAFRIDPSSPTAGRRVYLDVQATTPLDERVRAAMEPYLSTIFGNPHSVEHDWGLQAARAVDDATARIAAVIGAQARDIVLTSGATEANNMALRGLLPARGKARIVSCVTEHASVGATLDALEREGHTVVRLPVDGEGLIDLDALDDALEPRTALVSIMAANSEIGVLQPIDEIARLSAERGVPFHTDAAQAFGRRPLPVGAIPIGLMSLSSHKIYGPKGIGALYVEPALRRRLRPLITGGGQQDGLRAGTIPTALAVGFGHAASLMQADASESDRIRGLRDRLWHGLQARIDGIYLNGSVEARLVGNLNIRIDGVDAETLLGLVPELALSTGSACHSRAIEPSPVLLALGLTREQAAGAVRLGVGRTTTADEIDYAIDRLATAVSRLRA